MQTLRRSVELTANAVDPDQNRTCHHSRVAASRQFTRWSEFRAHCYCYIECKSATSRVRLLLSRSGIQETPGDSSGIGGGECRFSTRRTARMKCPSCWSEKAYRHKSKRSSSLAMATLGIVALRCQHCYHEFSRPFFMTIGQQIEAPTPIKSGNSISPSTLDLEAQSK